MNIAPNYEESDRMITWEPRFVTDLADGEVFVFGSNDKGLHGGGAAGFAHRKGWCEWGIASGLQRGPGGMSYGIVTIKEPGQLRSTRLIEIRNNVRRFLRFAANNPQLTFLVTPIGEVLAGWSPEELKAEVWDKVESIVPANVRFVRPPVPAPLPVAEVLPGWPITCPQCGEVYSTEDDLDCIGACNDNVFCVVCHCEFDPDTGEVHDCQKDFEIAMADRERGIHCDGKP